MFSKNIRVEGCYENDNVVIFVFVHREFACYRFLPLQYVRQFNEAVPSYNVK